MCIFNFNFVIKSNMKYLLFNYLFSLNAILFTMKEIYNHIELLLIQVFIT